MVYRLIVILAGIIFIQISTVMQELKDIPENNRNSGDNPGLRLFLCGDVMTGRGVDQVMPHSVNPRIYESYIKDARDYVRLAERKHGNIEDPVSYDYIWGDAMEVWKRFDPVFKIINLETSVTDDGDPWPGKGIHYRMHPGNTRLLSTAGIDFCSLANNHVLDWGREGLSETLQSLESEGITTAGAGKNLSEARKPAVLSKNGHRVIVFSYGTPTSGVLRSWAATPEKPGINLLNLDDKNAIDRINQKIQSIKQPGDLVVFSVHWGDNWGYGVPRRQQKFARRLIDDGGVDIVHGHSSHHIRGIEVYKNKLIIYGAGDFLNDYEGISGHEQYRDDLTLMYFPDIDPSSGKLLSMKMVPMQIRNFSLQHIEENDAQWLLSTLNREVAMSSTHIELNEDGSFSLHW
jgi:poly-gamma-glutamate synthesis protein (capsule biosynthesis protein)